VDAEWSFLFLREASGMRIATAGERRVYSACFIRASCVLGSESVVDGPLHWMRVNGRTLPRPGSQNT
jgi:hypothetical protein